MPTFCRHNRFIQNCPICREPEPAAPTRRRAKARGGTASPTRRGGAGGRAVSVSRAARALDDGYRCALVPGLRASADAARLADEIAFAAARLAELADQPPGLYATVASEPDPEEALWLAFLIAYLCPLDGEDPFAGIAAARTSWASGDLPELDGMPTGLRTAHAPGQGEKTLLAYRAWAQRAGSQVAAFTGEPHWTAERRFARTFERLALPGFHRAARFDLLACLGRLGRCDVRADSLFFADDETTLGAKRVFGIADPLLLDRRVAELAEICEVPLEALDLALFNWHLGGDRVRLGATLGVSGPNPRERVARALAFDRSPSRGGEPV